MKKKGRKRRKEGEEEDEKGNEPPLDVFARFATGCRQVQVGRRTVEREDEVFLLFFFGRMKQSYLLLH